MFGKLYLSQASWVTQNLRTTNPAKGHESHEIVATPNRADEFVPEGRLLVGRPFTTCATLVAVPVFGRWRSLRGMGGLREAGGVTGGEHYSGFVEATD